MTGTAVILVVFCMGKDSSFVHSQPIFNIGRALDVPKVLFRGVKPLVTDESRAFTVNSDLIQGSKAILSLM